MAERKEGIRQEIDDIREKYGNGRDMIRTALEKSYKTLFENLENAEFLGILSEIAKDLNLGIRVQKTSGIASVFARIAIVPDRKKAHPYAKIFRQALDAKVKPDGFLQWLDDNGGIEMVRLSKTPIDEETRSAEKERIMQVGEKYLGMKPVKANATFDRDVSFAGQTALVLVRRSDGEKTSKFQVVDVFDRDNPTTASLLRKYGEESEKQEKQEKQVAETLAA